MILLTSFMRSRALDPKVERLSVAVYQPTGFAYQKLDFFDIRDESGKWTRPRDFIPDDHDPSKPSDAVVGKYRAALYGLYIRRIAEIDKWAKALNHDVALCCWCPYDRAAQRQLADYGTFLCHTAGIGLVLRDARVFGSTVPPIIYDDDRQKMVRW